VRVVAGSAGGRVLRAPEGTATRPTSDRVREAMFNALRSLDAVEGATVADLYAGSGALGIEALSRGAGSVTFVESSHAARSVIEDNLRTTGLAERATVVAGDAIAHLEATPGGFDLILADPPYADTDIDTVVAALSGWVAPDGLVILERSTRSAAPAWPAFLTASRVRKYGDTALHWAEHHAAEA
jgi:16S rRNA (guanine966-N2)-methyltransferase